MKKIFISQPMNGRTDEAIKAEIAEEVYNYFDEEVEIIDSFIEEVPHDATPVWCLGESIKLLSTADYAYFAEGWEKDRGCQIEHATCVKYKIPAITPITIKHATRRDDCNTGDWNTGDWNADSFNTGSFNTGSFNTGSFNAGNFNAGNYNAGDWNTGDHNTGDYNTGDWNTGRFNTGCFNTTSSHIYLFNRPSEWTYTTWVFSEARDLLGKMMDYIDDPKEAPAWWCRLSDDERATIMAIPNFDKAIFKKITGIDVDCEGETK